MTGISDLGREQAEQSQEDSQQSEWDSYDPTGDAWARMHPTTAVTGEPVALWYSNPEEYTPTGAIVLRNPEVITDDEATEGTTVIRSDSDRGDDFKFVNADDEATRIMEDGDEDIALFDGNEFAGELVDSVDLDDGQHLMLKFGGSSMRQVLRRLDANGAQAADVRRDDDGDVVLNNNGYPVQNRGLIEYDPQNDRDDSHFEYQVARDPVLRDDVQDGRVGVMLQRRKDLVEDYDGRAYFTTVFEVGEDGERSVIEPTEDTEAVPLGCVIDTGWLEWSYPDEETYDGDSGNGTTTTTSESSSDTTGLTDTEIAAIDRITQDIEGTDGEVDRDGITTVVEDSAEAFEDDTDLDTVVDEIETRV